MDDYRNEAVRTLEALVNHLDRLPPNHTPEAARLCAKVGVSWILDEFLVFR